MSKTAIHPTAIVDSGAEIGKNVSIGPYAIIGKHVKIGNGTQVHGHALIAGYTTIGENCQIYSFASVGNPPQDLKYKGEPTTLLIGDHNIVREYVTLQPGTIQGGGITSIGNENLFMAYVHVAHDCIIGHKNILANGVQLAGHVTIHNMATLGGLSAIHQFCIVGDLSITSGGTYVGLDIPPYCVADGHRASLRGLNVVGMQRRGLNSEIRDAIKVAYKALLMEEKATREEAIKDIPQDLVVIPEVQYFINFVRDSKRGTIRIA